MTYKLKDHVTDEMLVAVGFRKLYHDVLAREKDFFDENSIYVENKVYVKYIKFSFQHVKRNITPLIQDLIELGYVEEMK